MRQVPYPIDILNIRKRQTVPVTGLRIHFFSNERYAKLNEHKYEQEHEANMHASNAPSPYEQKNH